jgi:DNA modification methylase
MKPYYDDGKGIQLFLGDCRALLPALAGESIDFVFTDPPYGHNNQEGDLQSSRVEGNVKGARKRACIAIANDGAEANALVRWAFAEFARLLKPGCCCCCCCCGGGGPDPQFARWSLWLDEAIGFKQMVVWDKGGLGMGWHYRRSYETILVGEKPGAACRWYDESNSVSNVIRLNKIIPSKYEHPTVKPVALASHFMRLHTQPGDLILDPFAGSGTTLVAARDSGCRAIGIEVEEKFAEMAAKRLAQGILQFGEVDP